MIEIGPDSRHPHGGFAEITISGIEPFDGPVLVSVFNIYQHKWLGTDGWQPNRMTFPARSVEWSGDRLTFTVGPDIVNEMEEDTPIRIGIGELEFETYWPDDVNHGPDDAVVGEIGGTGAIPPPDRPVSVSTSSTAAADPAKTETAQADQESADSPLNGPASDSKSPSAVDTAPTAAADPAESETVRDDQESGGRPMRFVLLAAVLAVAIIILAGAAWFFFLREEPEPTSEPPLPSPAVSETVQLPPCGMESLNELSSEGFSPVADQLRSCGGEVSADNALAFVERAAAANDAAALLLFGMLYDQEVFDEAIEGQIGLTFPDHPALAAEYYARAVAAGSTEAETLLAGVCRRLSLQDDTLSGSAHEDHCQGQ